MSARLAGKEYMHILPPQYLWDTWACPKTADGKIDYQKAMTGDDLNDFVNKLLNNEKYNTKNKRKMD